MLLDSMSVAVKADRVRSPTSRARVLENSGAAHRTVRFDTFKKVPGILGSHKIISHKYSIIYIRFLKDYTAP